MNSQEGNLPKGQISSGVTHRSTKRKTRRNQHLKHAQNLEQQMTDRMPEPLNGPIGKDIGKKIPNMHNKSLVIGPTQGENEGMAGFINELIKK